jgi:hypothetical protein
MADYRVVDKEQLEADLTTVADAIREKGGTSESLAFPEGMKNAIEAIETGIDTSSDNPAESSDIAKDKEAFVNGQKVTGSVQECTTGDYDWELLEVDYLGKGLNSDQIELETLALKDAIVRQGAYVGVKLPCSEFGDAKPEEVMSGKIFTSSSGYKKTGTYVPLDTSSSNPATSSDMTEGTEAFVNGQKVTGKLREQGSYAYFTDYLAKSEVSGASHENAFRFGVDASVDRIIRAGTESMFFLIGKDEFGTAKAENVMQGVTFTSENGVKIDGTYEPLDTTSTNPVTDLDIPEGKEAFVNGQKVTGVAISWQDGLQQTLNPSAKNGYLVMSISPIYPFHIPSSAHITFRTSLNNLGNAVASDVVKGKTFTSTSGIKVEGTYEPLDTSDANATASDIVSDKTAYVNGVKITGNIAKKSAQTYTPTTSDQTIASGQYLDGVQTIKGDANLVSANIKKGATIFGVAGSFEGGPQVGAIVKAQAVSNVQIASGMSSRVNYGSTLTVSNGVVSISDSTSLTISAVSSLDVVKGKYIQPTASYGATTAVYFVPSTATFTQGGSTYSKTYTVSTVNEMFVYGGV